MDSVAHASWEGGEQGLCGLHLVSVWVWNLVPCTIYIVSCVHLDCGKQIHGHLAGGSTLYACCISGAQVCQWYIYIMLCGFCLAFILLLEHHQPRGIWALDERMAAQASFRWETWLICIVTYVLLVSVIDYCFRIPY